MVFAQAQCVSRDDYAGHSRQAAAPPSIRRMNESFRERADAGRFSSAAKDDGRFQD